MKIRLFTMVKNEVDVVEYWLKYHGSIFGYNNLHVIDNNSDDGTYEKLLEYEKEGIQVYRESDYKMKGILMTKLIKEQHKEETYDVAIPMDIDEFIVHYDKKNNILDPMYTREYINQLVPRTEKGVFKMNYVTSTINSKDNYGYKNAVLESLYGLYEDYGRMAKTFFNVHKWSGKLDHGNHYVCEDYFLTDLVLVHYHCRNLDQMKKKVESNVSGLGYEINKESLEQILRPEDKTVRVRHIKRKKVNVVHHSKTKQVNGEHHIKNMIKIIDNTFQIDTCVNGEGVKDFVSLKPIIDYCSTLKVNHNS